MYDGEIIKKAPSAFFCFHLCTPFLKSSRCLSAILFNEKKPFWYDKDIVNPFIVKLWGANINRDTILNISLRTELNQPLMGQSCVSCM